VANLPEPWRPLLNWETPAGKALSELVRALPKDQRFQITVFGSAPLQLGLDAGFLSADVDIFSEGDVSEIVAQHGLGKGSREVYIECCAPTTFASTSDWHQRVFVVEMGNAKITFPHPLDILVSKLSRLEDKDLRAFELVREKMGIPTESELKRALMNAVDLYRPSFDEENRAGDIFQNTQIVWQKLFGKGIDVRADIIRPAIEERQRHYGTNSPDHKGRLRQISGFGSGL
jgi:hypothetical protein